MQGIGFGFEANENRRKTARIDCESDGDENVQETQIIDNPTDRVIGTGQAGTIPGFVTTDGNLEANLKNRELSVVLKNYRKYTVGKGKDQWITRKLLKD